MATLPWWAMAVPYRRFTITSTIGTTMARQRLADAVQPSSGWLSWRAPVKPFEGRVEGSTFVIRRAINYRNSFLPQVTGEITPSGAGVALVGRMALHTVTIIFLALWISGGVAIFLTLLSAGNFRSSTVLIALGVLAFIWLVVAGGFALEAARTARVLTALVEGTLAWG